MDNWTRDHGREEDSSDNKALDVYLHRISTYDVCDYLQIQTSYLLFDNYDVRDCLQIQTSNPLFDNKKSKYC